MKLDISTRLHSVYWLVDTWKQHKGIMFFFVFTSLGFAAWRTTHFLDVVLHIRGLVAWSAVAVIELMLIALYAAIINTKKYQYRAFLREDDDLKLLNRSVLMLEISFYLAMGLQIFIAFYDAYLISNNWYAGGIFAGIQVVLVSMYIGLIAMAESDQRKEVKRKLERPQHLFYCTCGEGFETRSDLQRHMSYFKNKGDNSHMEDR